MDLDGMSALNLFSRFTGISSVSDPRRDEVIQKLPSLNEQDLSTLDQKDCCCPICFTPFLAILASEETALAMESPAFSAEDLGVTRLAETCGHVFCRKDIITWIRQHDTCPTCRRPFITRSAAPTDVGTPQENEQSNGNAYIIHIFSGSEPPSSSDEWLERQFTASHLGRPAAQEDVDTREQENGSRQDVSNHDDGRDEFIGMYS